MGLLPKYKIEALKREKREAKAAKKRKENTRSKIVRFLIVCEGSRTEPNYFQALVRDRYSEVRDEKIVGEGKSTCALVKRTLQIKDELERKRQFSRHDYIEKLQSEIRKHPGYENYEYKKNDASIYKMLTTIGNEDLAKRCAERLRSFFDGDEDYKEHKPCTTVDLLVIELENPERFL